MQQAGCVPGTEGSGGRVSLIKKLLIKPGMRVGFMNAPEGFRQSLGELPAGVTPVDAHRAEPGSLDLIMVFVQSLAELAERAPVAISLAKYDGLLWIAYPKKTSKIKTDINRDTGWAKMSAIGYAGVAMVALDETWSAMRYRPAERVGQ